MQGGFVRGICFLAFLLSSGIKGEKDLNTFNQLDDEASRNSAVAVVLTGDKVDDGVSLRASHSPLLPSPNTASAKSVSADIINSNRNVGWRSDDSETLIGIADLDALDEALTRHDIVGRSEEIRSNLNENEDNLSGAISRVVPPNEYIIPSIIPGGESLVNCQAENEIHQVRTPDLQCLVCICIKDGWYIRSVCVSCSTCLEASLPQWIPEEPAIIPAPIIPQPPILEPESQVSCAPLPENVPFQNPLNPCQICICEKTFNVFGQLDIQIQCKEDPLCGEFLLNFDTHN
ncbi:unnamed protein product [Euphydryas editha]|uniref:Uncharacterized protein n=1 Tax=Euphydryas editha TaxID=104508 RepID=A0AAU9UCJ4_EUPED|nr:unnamed protein product [Euphydryas editha]